MVALAFPGRRTRLAPRAALPVAAVAALAATTSPGVAQGTPPFGANPPPVTVRGVVYDSLTRRPLAGALVEVAGTSRTALADRLGRFRVDSVPPGPHRVTFSAPALDSIGLYGFGADVMVDPAGGTGSLTLATPSLATLHARLCAAPADASADSAIVFGSVYNAGTRARRAGAQVALRWFAVDTAGTGARLVQPLRLGRSDEQGDFAVCGVPHDVALTTLAGDPQTASGPISLTVGPARVLRRDLYVSDEMGADSVVAGGSGGGGAAAGGAPRGTGALRGVVRDESGQPLVGALLLLTASGHATRTDSLGRWAFRQVPLGTQEVSVRQLGRGALYRVVDIVGGTTGDEAFTLPQATVLAPVNVRGVAIPGRDQAEFLSRRRAGFGRFLDARELTKRPDLAAALSRLPGVEARYGIDGLTVRGTRPGRCGSLRVIIDGVPGMAGLDMLNVRDLVGVEYYPDGTTAPPKYLAGLPTPCGVLLVWTRFARW